uniref:Musashi n=1 Tax=Dugesia japonica TaxID=6161 RepID=B1Q3I8_DUGJA|nr:musashi [Dugesia japonica]
MLLQENMNGKNLSNHSFTESTDEDFKNDFSSLEEISASSNEPCKLFVGGLNPTTTSEALQSYFSQFGEIKEFMVMRDIVHKRSRGFGFVTFTDYNGVIKVLKQENHILDSKKIDPKLAVPKSICQPEKISARTKKIFIGGIATSSTVEEIRQYFNRYGEVENCELMMDKATNRHRGFGFVTFLDEDVAEQICQIHYHNINNKMVEAKKALPKELLSTSNTSIKSENKSLQVPLAILQNNISPTFSMNNILQQNNGSFSPFLTLPYLHTNSGPLLLNPNLIQIANTNGISPIQTIDPLFPNDIVPYLNHINNFSASYIPPLTSSINNSYIGQALPTLHNGSLPMQNFLIDLSHQAIADPKYFPQQFSENVKSVIYPNLNNISKRQLNSNSQQKSEPMCPTQHEIKDKDAISCQSMNHFVGRYSNNGLMTMMMMSGSLDGNSTAIGTALPDCSNSLEAPTGDSIWLIPAKIPRVH